MLTHTQDHSTMSLRNRRCSCIPVRSPSPRQGLADCQRPLPPANSSTREQAARSIGNWRLSEDGSLQSVKVLWRGTVKP